MLIQYAILLLFYLLCFQIEPTHSALKQCLLYPVKEMQSLKYRSDKHGNIVDIKIQPAQFNHGATGQVFIGYSGKNVKNLPKDTCIAIKLYGVNDGDQYVNSEKILKALNNVEMAKEHIINMLDYGKFEDPQKNVRFMTILELGVMSLDQELHRGKKRTNSELKSLIKDVMNTLVIMHRVAVHLDFKPKNLLLFERKNFLNTIFPTDPDFSIKLTDFDGSFLFMNGSKIVKVTKNDNICCTFMYAAPELINAREHLYGTNIITSVASSLKSILTGSRQQTSANLTPKMDIWAAGVTIYEIVISNFFNSNSKDTLINQGDFEKNIINKVALINKLYSDANWYIGKVEMLPNWWDTYSGVLPNMLDIWHKLPEIGFLLLNMMDIDPAKRMSAKGVIDYLDRKCKPMHRKIALFSNVTAEQLQSWIEAELNLWTLRKTNKEDRYLKFVQNLEKTLKKAVEYQKNFQKELDTRTAHCET